MPYQCTTPGCEKQAIFDTNVCDDCLEEAALANVRNFGDSEVHFCGECGTRFYVSDKANLMKILREHLDKGKCFP